MQLQDKATVVVAPVTPDAKDLPWACNKEQLHTIRERCQFMTNVYSSGFDDTICIPAGFSGVHFEEMSGMPGHPKSAEYLLLASPVRQVPVGWQHACSPTDCSV